MENPTEAGTGPKPSRHLLHLSVRALMLAVLVLALALGWYVSRANVQSRAVAAIRKSGGNVTYDWQQGPGRRVDPKAEPKAPRWLVERLGVDYFGDVVMVQLGKQATDVEMAHAGRLKKLISVAVPQTAAITDAGAAHLAGLVDLVNVNLTGTKVTGAFLANLRDKTKLTSLPLIGLSVTDDDLVHLEGLTGLTDLDLTSTQVTDAGLAHLEGLIKLDRLNLKSTQVTGPGLDHLKGMTKLRNLDLTKCQVRDLSALPALPALKWLFLDDTPVVDAQLPPVAKLPALYHLGLYRSGITDAGLVELEPLNRTLTGLSLGGTQVSDAGVPALLRLDKLERLFLDGTKVTDASLDQIASLGGLKVLDVGKTGVTDAGIAQLSKALPQIKMLKDLQAADAQARAKARAARGLPPLKPRPQP